MRLWPQGGVSGVCLDRGYRGHGMQLRIWWCLLRTVPYLLLYNFISTWRSRLTCEGVPEVLFHFGYYVYLLFWGLERWVDSLLLHCFAPFRLQAVLLSCPPEFRLQATGLINCGCFDHSSSLGTLMKFQDMNSRECMFRDFMGRRVNESSLLTKGVYSAV